MDKIAKALKKLSAKERESAKKLLEKIEAGELKGLDTKKLKNRDDIFRARKGDMRVIYRVQDGSIYILALERRSEKTYKG
jgi:mRNA-degrading endonuclease RelE of RelBE toxin-antitoxin system